jgi:hypothetical protein
MTLISRARLALLGALAVASSAAPAFGQISQTPVSGLSNARVYRSNAAYDSVNQVYLVITQRPPVRGRFLDKNGNQIGGDFTIALEPGEPYTGWASVAFGGPSNDPTFIVTYIVADQVTNPKFARLVRYQQGSNPTVGPALKIADLYNEWLFAEKAQNVWNGGQFIVGSRVQHPGSSLPSPQVNLVDMDGTVSGPVLLGDGTDYQGSPAIACSSGGICLAIGFMAGIPSGYSGGTYGRLFNGITLEPQGGIFNVNFGTPNEDQGVVFLAHTGFFLTQWFRGGGPGYIDTRIVSPDGTMSTIDISRSIGPGAGCNYLIYNAGTQTALLVTKGSSAELLAIELGDDGYPRDPNNILTLTPWDGAVLDYLPSIAANAADGQWLVTAEKAAGPQGWIIQGLFLGGGGSQPANILTGATLPTATEQTPYTKFLIATGSTAPYTWSLQSGTLPPGITLNGSTLSGTPTTPGTYNFRIRVTGTDAQFAEKDFTLIVNQIIVAGSGPSGANISNGPVWGLWPGNAYRNNTAYDPINQVYLVIVRRPPVTGRFYNKDGVQIGPDFIIADEPGEPYTAWASIAHGGPSNDPAFIVTYVIAGGANPKMARFVRYVNGSAPNVSPGYHIADVGSEWLFAEKAQSVWNGQKFVVGTRMKLPGMSLPTFQVNHIELNGTVSAGVDLGNGFDYYGSPALSCATNGICLAMGFMAGIPSGFTGGTYARLFNGSTLAPQGNLFHLDSGRPNEDQGVVYQSHTGYFLTQWYRGGGPGFIDTRLVGTNGTMSILDLSRGIGPNAGTNAFAYNPSTRTTLLLTKGENASLFAMELGDNGYPLNPNNWILVTLWDGAVLDYLPSVAANPVDGHWLVTYELQGGGFGRIIHGTPNAGGCSFAVNPSGNGFGAGGGSGSFDVIVGSGCAWTATANQGWIHTSSSGSGNGSVSYTVDANGGTARNGSISVAGVTFNVSQAAAETCSYGLNPTNSGSLPATGSGGLILVSAGNGCPWSPSTGFTWIHPSGSGSGNGTVGYTVDANPGAMRTGSIVVGGQTFSIVQAAVGTQKAELTSPAPSSTLTSSTATFQWTGGIGAAQYWLYIGTSPGSFDILSRDMGTQLSTVVNNLPNGGQTLYVRLHSHISGWQWNDYTLTAGAAPQPQKAELTSPAPGSTLTSASHTFQWTGGVGVAQYWLYVGTTPGSFDIVSRDAGTQLSTVVNNLPTNGQTLYIRLHSHIGSWQWTDYTLTASGTTTAKAQLTSPAPGSTLTSSTVTFNWTGGAGVAQYWLYVGTTPGSFDVVSRDAGTQLSTVVSNIPTNGQTLYVRLHSHIGGWQWNDYTLTAATIGTQKAQLISPAPGSSLDTSTVTFQWTGGTGVAAYWLYVGTTQGTFDILSRDMGTELSTVVNNLPTNGQTLWVRLLSHISGEWQWNDYTLTAAIATSQKAQLTSPAPSSTLTSTTATFQWTGGSGVAQYWLYVGTSPGAFDIVSRDAGTALSTVVNNLPANGQTLYVRLHSHIGQWQWNDYTLTASGSAPAKAQLISPAPSSTLTSTTVTFQWTGGTGVAQYWLYVGTTPGTFDIVSRDAGTQLSTVVANLPSNGQTLYVRLFSHIGEWQWNDYVLTAVSGGEVVMTPVAHVSTLAPEPSAAIETAAMPDPDASLAARRFRFRR